ncbi:3-oxoacyl-reductase [Aspergillus keveii]|uniref:3-oxoacyl-reductase n=1 Tax=Aspergillus keveii TaxID=714993 RepID=A0ABR4G1K2_9EURO
MAFLVDGVAIVTGAGSGIGKACALSYAAEGVRGVIIADLNLTAAEQTARETEAVAVNPEYKALALAVDVTDPSSVEKMVSTAVATFGRIDYLVNSAGVGVKKHRSVEEVSASDMERFWKVNIMGTVHCTQAVARVMKEQNVATFQSPGRGSSREVGRGVIVNLGSANSYMATPEVAPYVTTKHAVIGLTKNSALDLAKYQIRVNAICPGWTRTPMVEEALNGNPNLDGMMKSVVPMKRIAFPEEIADIVVFMTSPRSSYVTGVGWIVDGGLTLQVQTC